MKSFLQSATALLLLSWLGYNSALSQEKGLGSQEDKFVTLYAKLFSFIQADNDSIRHYANLFEMEFSHFIKNNPCTLNYPFQKLIANNFLLIRTSSDGQFRIYGWDSWTGGSMHPFEKYKNGKGMEKFSQKVSSMKRLIPEASAPKYTTYISVASPIA